jgi:hypothetical protein
MSGRRGDVVGADGFELCLAFLLGASVGYAFRAAISNIRRAKVRRQRREEYYRALEHSAKVERLMAEQQSRSAC